MSTRRLKCPAVSSYRKAWNWIVIEIKVMHGVLMSFRGLIKNPELRKLSGEEYMNAYCDCMNVTIGSYMRHVVSNFEECHELFQSFKTRRLYMEGRAKHQKSLYHMECSKMAASQNPQEP